MQPFSEFRNQLFISSGGDPQRIMEFSCDHVIPQENILTGCLSQGPSGKILNFSYESRNSPELVCQHCYCVYFTMYNIFYNFSSVNLVEFYKMSVMLSLEELYVFLHRTIMRN